MRPQTSRRRFLQGAMAGGAALGFAGAAAGTGNAGAAEPPTSARAVPLNPAIEPLVRLLEETPRERLVETVAARVGDGLEYRRLLAALQLAGVRNVEPRPSVGYKFHAVLAVLSVHLASQGLSGKDRWLPIFWALDYFKESQARDERERGWTMAPVDAKALPPAGEAAEAFAHAMEQWNEPEADAAVAALARNAKPEALFERLYRLGARDYRSIGHKAIFIANGKRVLDFVGAEHTEPIVRSMAYALLMHEDGNPAQRDDPADRPWRRNQGLASEIPDGWQQGKPDLRATDELLAVLHDGSESAACDKVVELLGRGVAPQSIWDGLFVGAAELLARQPGIVALHSLTTTNALHYAFTAAKEDRTRRLVLLQNAAFLPMFRQSMEGRGRVGDWAIADIQTAKPESSERAVEEIFAVAGGDRRKAAGKILGYLDGGGDPKALVGRARHLVALKGSGAHDYKLTSAVLEDFGHVSAPCRARYLAGCVFGLCHSGEPDDRLVARTRAALGA